MFGWLRSKSLQIETTPDATASRKLVDTPPTHIPSLGAPLDEVVVSTSATSCEQARTRTPTEEEAAMLTGPAWKQQLATAEADWQSLHDLLIETLTTLQDARDSFALMICSSYFCIEPPHDQSLYSPDFRDRLVTKIDSLVSEARYRVFISEKMKRAYNTYQKSQNFYMDEFLLNRNSFIEGAIGVFANFDANGARVEKARNFLNEALRELRPEAGGIGLSMWVGHTKKFAKENLVGIDIDDLFPESFPRYIKDFIREDLSKSASLFVMQVLAAVDQLEKAHRPASTSAVGIEFENRLREIIEAEFDDAIVETTPASGDQGADLLVRLGSVRVAIQAKRYSGVVGNAAVQEIFAAKQFYDTDFAMVVTNSRYTMPAKALADKLEVTLATSDDFIEKIKWLLG